MSGETIEVLATANVQVLETNGISVANGTILQVSSPYDKMAAAPGGGAGYPDGQIILAVTFNTAPVENSLISLYAREYPQDGAIRTDAPEATRPGRVVCSFPVNDRTGLQELVLMVSDLPPKADYYIHNNGTGQAIASGWKLSIVPRTFRPAV